MRIAAGIILIVLGAMNAPDVVIILRELATHFSHMSLYWVSHTLLGTVQAPICITGGIFCLRRRYWRVYLALVSFAVFVGVFAVVGGLLGYYPFESLSDLSNRFLARVVVLLLPWVISLIFISRTRKEWQ